MDEFRIEKAQLRRAFAGRLEAARRHHGAQTGHPRLTRGQFAEAVGIERARYARYERGETEPSLMVLDRLRKVTGISLDWLVAGLTRGSEPRWEPERQITVGDRLRWAREIQEP